MNEILTPYTRLGRPIMPVKSAFGLMALGTTLLLIGTTPGAAQTAPAATPNAPTSYTEKAVLSAPLFYLSKKGASVAYLAETAPGATASTKASNTSDPVTAFDISADGQVAYGTSKGALMVPGRKPWTAPATQDPLAVTSIAWSPDNQTVAFTLRASDADFQTNAKQEASGVYLWGANDPQPTQFIADLFVGTKGYQYTVKSYSPDGTLLLLGFTEITSKSYGWITASINPKNSFGVVTYAASDPVRYLNAGWTYDGSVIVFNQDTTDPTAVNNGVLVDQSGNRTRPLQITDPLDKSPLIVSSIQFMPGNDVFVLGATGRDQPLQPYLGTYIASSASISVKPIGQAFKLKWPGVAIPSTSGFPVYIVDDQYGVVLFRDNAIFSYYPSDLAMSALDSAVYDSSFAPGWKFAALGSTPKLP